MKKFFTILLFLAVALCSTAQSTYDPYDRYYCANLSVNIGDNAMASDQHVYPWTCKFMIINGSMSFNYPLSERTQWFFNTNLAFGTMGHDMYAALFVGTGAKFFATEHLYWYISFYPHISIHGNGVQTNGDEVNLWTDACTGPGYRWDAPHGYWFVEVGISKGVDMIAPRFNHKNDVFMYLTAGYSFRIL